MENQFRAFPDKPSWSTVSKVSLGSACVRMSLVALRRAVPLLWSFQKPAWNALNVISFHYRCELFGHDFFSPESLK